jgi:N-acetylmuramoyl-L-alanine amidase
MKPLLLFTLLLSLGSNLFGATYGQRMVAAVLVAEAGVDGTEGMTAVAEVIRNRADARGISPLAVVMQPGQFTPVTRAGSVDNLYFKHSRSKFYKEALRIAVIAYNTPEKLPGITKGATYFHVTNMPPYWANGLRPVATVGSHHFYAPTGRQKPAPRN